MFFTALKGLNADSSNMTDKEAAYRAIQAFKYKKDYKAGLYSSPQEDSQALTRLTGESRIMPNPQAQRRVVKFLTDFLRLDDLALTVEYADDDTAFVLLPSVDFAYVVSMASTFLGTHKQFIKGTQKVCSFVVQGVVDGNDIIVGNLHVLSLGSNKVGIRLHNC